MGVLDVLWISLFTLTLLFFHELGHVIAAKFMGLNIKGVSFSLRPIPHFYVRIDWPRDKKQRNIFLLSGTATTLFLFLISLIFGLDSRLILLAFSFQIVMEFNPFYSDFVIIAIAEKALKQVRISRVSYDQAFKSTHKKYFFSNGWYAHFVLWTLLILALSKGSIYFFS